MMVISQRMVRAPFGRSPSGSSWSFFFDTNLKKFTAGIGTQNLQANVLLQRTGKYFELRLRVQRQHEAVSY